MAHKGPDLAAPAQGIEPVMAETGETAKPRTSMKALLPLLPYVARHKGWIAAALTALVARGASLIVCVDCGTAAAEALSVLSGKAVERISNSVLDELVVTDTIPLTDEAAACTRIRQLSVATLLGESINRMNSGQSLSSMFID